MALSIAGLLRDAAQLKTLLRMALGFALDSDVLDSIAQKVEEATRVYVYICIYIYLVICLLFIYINMHIYYFLFIYFVFV